MSETSDLSVYYLPYGSAVATNCVFTPVTTDVPSDPETPSPTPKVTGFIRNCVPMDIAIVESGEQWIVRSLDGKKEALSFNPRTTPHLLFFTDAEASVYARAAASTKAIYDTMNAIRQETVREALPTVWVANGPLARLTLGLGELFGSPPQYTTGTMQELGLQLTLPRSGGMFWLAPITSGLRVSTFLGTRAAAAYEAPTLPFSGYSTDIPIGVRLDLDWVIRALSNQWREPLAPPRVNVVAGYETPLIGRRSHDTGDMTGTHTALLYPGQDHRFSLGAEFAVTEWLLVGVAAFHNIHGGPLPLSEDGVRFTISLGQYPGQARKPAPPVPPVRVIAPHTEESRNGDTKEAAATPLR